jgi:hypothetical protein
VRKRNPEGIDGLINETPPLEEMTLKDWFASFAILTGADAKEAYEIARDMIKERKVQ